LTFLEAEARGDAKFPALGTVECLVHKLIGIYSPLMDDLSNMWRNRHRNAVVICCKALISKLKQAWQFGVAVIVQ